MDKLVEFGFFCMTLSLSVTALVLAYKLAFYGFAP